MGQESVIENEAFLFGEKLGFVVRKVVYAGRRGAPDRWFFGRGYTFCIEFKKRGGKPEPIQVKEIGRLNDAGVPVYVADTIERAWEIIRFYADQPARVTPKV